MITVEEIQKKFNEWDELDSRSKEIVSRNETSRPKSDADEEEVKKIKEKKDILEKEILTAINKIYDENKAKIPYSETDFKKDMNTSVRCAFQKIERLLAETGIDNGKH